MQTNTMDNNLEVGDRLFNIFCKYDINKFDKGVQFLLDNLHMLNVDNYNNLVKDLVVDIDMKNLSEEVNGFSAYDYVKKTETTYKIADWVAAMKESHRLGFGTKGLSTTIKKYTPIVKDVYYITPGGLVSIYKYHPTWCNEKIISQINNFIGLVALAVDNLNIRNGM